jgi:hypothetical protein
MNTILIALFALVLGALFLFWGYRVFLVMLPIWGFFAGFWLGAQTTSLLFGAGFLATTTGWVVGFFIGLLFALLSYLFYLVGVALVAAAVGAALVTGFLSLFGLETGLLVFLAALVGAVVVAGLTLVFNLQKYVIIILTAVGGANSLVLSVLLLFGRVTPDDLAAAGNAIRPVLQDSWFWALVWILLAIVGIIFQFRTNRTFVFKKEHHVEGWY